MRHGWRAGAVILAAMLIAGAGIAQEPVKVKSDDESGKLTVKDTGEKVKVKKSGSKYKIKETGEKFKIKETRSGGKVKGTSVKIKSSKPARRAGSEERVSATPAAKKTPRLPATPVAETGRAPERAAQ